MASEKIGNVKIDTLFASQDNLNKLLETNVKASTAYKLSRIATKVSEELKICEETRRNLVMEYGEEDENGTTKVTEENRETFNNEINDLFQNEIELPFEKISIDDLVSSRGVEADITPTTLVGLEWLFKD